MNEKAEEAIKMALTEAREFLSSRKHCTYQLFISMNLERYGGKKIYETCAIEGSARPNKKKKEVKRKQL